MISEGRRLLSSAATTNEIRHTGVTVASLFFGNVFGAKAQKALTVFVALRCVRGLSSRHIPSFKSYPYQRTRKRDHCREWLLHFQLD